MTTKILITGEAVDSASEAWRHECEARMIAELPSTEQRHSYIDVVERRRGAAAAKALRELATAIRMQSRKVAP